MKLRIRAFQLFCQLIKVLKSWIFGNNSLTPACPPWRGHTSTWSGWSPPSSFAVPFLEVRARTGWWFDRPGGLVETFRWIYRWFLWLIRWHENREQQLGTRQYDFCPCLKMLLFTFSLPSFAPGSSCISSNITMNSPFIRGSSWSSTLGNGNSNFCFTRSSACWQKSLDSVPLRKLSRIAV